ncbi:MAG: hypothetical protein ACP6IY_18880 [Promethearchaeia archaeon]
MEENLISQAIAFLLHNPIGWFIIAIIVILLIYLKKIRQPDYFKEEKLSDVLEEKFIKKLEIIKSQKKYKDLKRGSDTIGKILRCATWETKNKKNIIKFYLFEIGSKNLIEQKIQKFLRIKIKLFIVPANLVNFKNGYFCIEELSDINVFGNICFISSVAKKYIENLAWAKAREDELEENINYAKKVSYYSMRQSLGIERLEKLAELQRKKWEAKIEDLVKED